MLATPNPTRLSKDEQRAELLRCAASPLYFVSNYCHIYDAVNAEWIPFDLWPEQIEVLRTIHAFQKTVILKARQLGMTWLVLGYALWTMLFRPIASILSFSRRDDEAVHLVDDRLKGMYRRLPDWMQARRVTEDSSHEWTLSNGSTARAFPTTGGDSYTATLAIVDEADLIENLGKLLTSVKPTIDMGGKLVLLSRPDKSKPASPFKTIYRAAKDGQNDWKAIFIPWHAHPLRDEVWYAREQRESLENTGSLDSLWEQYPSTDAEALAPRTLDKRIAPDWLLGCYIAQSPLKLDETMPSIPGLLIYKRPVAVRTYVIGVDPAEGNPTSDDSALTVLDRETQEEVAHLSGKFQPSTIASHADAIGRYFNNASVLVERNNHGHAVLLWLRDNSKLTRLPPGSPPGKDGWLSNTLGKARLYDTAADAFRNHETTIHTFKTYTQLTSIEGSTLRAPGGEPDDCADSYALALAGNAMPKPAGAALFDW